MNATTPAPEGNLPLTEAEPTVERRAAPVWPLLMLGVLLYAGGLYVDAVGGDFDMKVYAPYHSLDDLAALQPKSPGGEMIARGKRVFQTYCQVCHQATGLGLPGQYPPLAGSEWVLADQPTRIIRIVLNGATGPIEVKGQAFNNTMVPWRDMLKDEDIAAVLSYVRGNKDWGNDAGPVSPDEIKTIREEIKGRAAPFTAPELLAIPLAAAKATPPAK